MLYGEPNLVSKRFQNPTLLVMFLSLIGIGIYVLYHVAILKQAAPDITFLFQMVLLAGIGAIVLFSDNYIGAVPCTISIDEENIQIHLNKTNFVYRQDVQNQTIPFSEIRNVYKKMQYYYVVNNKRLLVFKKNVSVFSDAEVEQFEALVLKYKK